MKKIISTFLSLLLFSTVMYSQVSLNQNVTNYNNQEECKSDILLQQLIANDPNYAQTIANYKLLAKQGESLNKATLYKIPIVVHVVHLGEPEGTGTNISDAQIHSAINNLNQAYRNQAPYTGVDIEVEFCLASVNPSGNPTSGINRVNGSGTSDYATQGITNDGGSSMNEVTVKALSNWGNTNYYQFWIVAGIDGNMGGGGTQGYAYFSQASSKDGAVVLYNSFGYDPTGTLCYNLKSYTNQNVTTIHEVGHAFGLYHTFEGDGTGSDCPVNSDCSADGDEVCDTPPHKRSTSDCDAGGTNSCTGGSKSLYVHNFMDYSSDVCQTEFTANQKTKARAWLLAARLSLTTSTKCNPVAVPVSDFEAVCGSQSGCSGSSINFFDLSEGNPTAWSWSFTGGTPSTSSSQYPSVTYATPGTYAVSLTATNSFGTGNTVTKTGFITIYSSPTAACTNGIQNSGYYGYAISDVQFNTISNITSPTTNGYVDNSCSFTTTVDGGQSYNLAIDVEALGSQTGYHAVYIDYNNNGILTDAGETVLSGNLAAGNNATTFNTNVVIPLTATTGTLLRMRVINDQASLSGPCDNLFTGESEDYGIYITPTCTPPAVTSHPSNRTICQSTNTTFVVSATNAVSYQWQVNTGAGFNNISNGGVYSGATLATLTITGATIGMGGYTYRCVVTGSCAPTATSNSASLTVNATNTASSASSSPTLCISTLMANITHTTTGATGIGVPINLPAGVIAGFASNTITISGTPSASGTFNYTIPLTGGCGTVNATGIITVNPLPGNAGTITGSTSGCENATSVAYSISTVSGATGYNWTVPVGATVASGQNTTIITVDFGTNSGNVSVTPTNSCGNGGQASKAVTIAPCGSAPVANFSANPTTICAGESINFIDLSTNTPTSWNWNFGDGGSSSSQNTNHTYNTPGTYTVTLTATNGSGSDDEVKTNLITVNVLDDASFNYSVSTYCQDGVDPTPTISGTTGGIFTRSPVGLTINSSTGIIDLSASTTGTYTVTYTTGGACSDVQNVQVTVVNCGSTSLQPKYAKTYLAYSEVVACYPVTNATEYEFEFVPLGGGTPIIYTRGINNISFLLSWVTGLIDNTTYNVRVRAKFSGVFGSYGITKQIKTPPASSSTAIISTYCGKIYLSYSEQLNAYPVTNASEYEFEFTPVGGGSVVNYVRTGSSILLSWVTGLIDNTTYNVRVRAKVGGVFGNYGSSCQIKTPSANSSTSIMSTYCGKIYSSYSQQLNAYPVTNATEYEFEFTPVGGGSVVNYIRTGSSILLSWAVGLVNNTTYNVRVRAKVGGAFGNYGSSCKITTPSSSMELNETARLIGEEEEAIVEVIPTTLSIYPNPNTGDQINIVMENLTPNSTVMITDIYGKVILNKPLNTDLNQYNSEVKFDGKLSTGFYFVTVISEGSRITEKLIVR